MSRKRKKNKGGGGRRRRSLSGFGKGFNPINDVLAIAGGAAAAELVDLADKNLPISITSVSGYAVPAIVGGSALVLNVVAGTNPMVRALAHGIEGGAGYALAMEMKTPAPTPPSTGAIRRTMQNRAANNV